MRLLVTLGVFVVSVCLAVGCASAKQGWDRGIQQGGFESVNVYTPATFSRRGGGKRRALLIVLHGCMQPIDSFETANLSLAAEAHGMVIAVPDALDKAGYQCWPYWVSEPNRSRGDYARVLALASELASQERLGIDKDQIYISGISSGAVFANQVSCLAPDVFSGVGAYAGPSVGTSPAGAIGTCETVDVANVCRSFAGETNATYFATQIASVARGGNDTVVNACYLDQTANGFAELYGLSGVPAEPRVIQAGGARAAERLWPGGRVSALTIDGVGHAWSGGAGASGAYIESAGINYAAYLGEYFAKHNKRVKD